MIAPSCQPRSRRPPVARLATAGVAVLGLLSSACGTTANGADTVAAADRNPPAEAAPQAQSAAAPQGAAPTFTGAVAETINSGGYTYARLQADGKDVWIAATEFPAAKGERLTVPLEMPMRNFHSNTLDRDFALVYFVSQVARDGQSLLTPTDEPAPTPAAGESASPMTLGSSHGAATGTSPAPSAAASASASSMPSQTAPPAVQPNPPPAGGMSIADAWARRQSLSGTSVTVRGTVVKVNNGILGRNWFHLRDGSGKDADGTSDLTVTTDDTVRPVRPGEVVTVTGTLGIDKDFGAGYAYAAILEQAVIK